MEKSLLDLKPGQKAKIIRMEGDYGFQRKLRNIGLREGKIVKLVTIQFMHGPLVVEIDERQTVTIGRGMAEKIEVELLI